jgi:hypothetical protein
MLQKSKTTEEIRDWFRKQWTLVEATFPDQVAAGELNRMRKMFQTLTGERGRSNLGWSESISKLDTYLKARG